MKKKVVILGCENSHAKTFLEIMRGDKKYADIQVTGVYSDDKSASEKLAEQYGIEVMDSYSQAVGKVDGIIVTARHGAKHYQFASPYIQSGIPMFIDKPFTVSEDDAAKFIKEARAAKVRLCGGSCCKFEPRIKELKSKRESGVKLLGGFVRAPISLKNPHGDFFFYAQHLVESVCEIFGRSPHSVAAYQNGDKVTVIFRYADFDVTALFAEENYYYYAALHTEKDVQGGELTLDGNCFKAEFDVFFDLLYGGEQKEAYEDFISPVFIINAIVRSLASGKEEKIGEYGKND